ncbi:MAG: hypothetical protein KKC77_19455 [Proteobacteria bacterium]|nr:hypothetical protein [Pseudomonadota bacterium]
MNKENKEHKNRKLECKTCEDLSKDLASLGAKFRYLERQSRFLHKEIDYQNVFNAGKKQGHTQAIKEVLKIIDKRIKECKSCQLTDKYEEQIEEDQIMIDTLNYIKSEINSEKTAK